jgi:hypothetical protein
VRAFLGGLAVTTPHAATVPRERIDHVTDLLFLLGAHAELPRPGDETRTPILGLAR